MSVELIKMTKEEFDGFYAWSIDNHATELMEKQNLSRDDAVRKATAELAAMLPEGLSTPKNLFMTIIDNDCHENIGFIWTLHEVTGGRKQSFICDFTIWENKRRNGYATAALLLAEKQATAAGCQESVLFVSDANTDAKALYDKCGYRILRPAVYGKYMIKDLT